MFKPYSTPELAVHNLYQSLLSLSALGGAKEIVELQRMREFIGRDWVTDIDQADNVMEIISLVIQTINPRNPPI